MIYSNFSQFMESVVLPLRAQNPDHLRLDGELTRGNWDVAGLFRHHSKVWKVHSDSHYEPLLLAYEAAKTSVDPFVEEPTKHGTSLVLHADLRTTKTLRKFEYMYIYEDTDAEGA